MSIFYTFVPENPAWKRVLRRAVYGVRAVKIHGLAGVNDNEAASFRVVRRTSERVWLWEQKTGTGYLIPWRD